MAKRVNPPNSGDRPIVDLPRSRDNMDSVRLYALVVGINDYQGTVTPLGGCINDVNLVAKYLHNHPVYGKSVDKAYEPIANNASVDKTIEAGNLHLRILTNAEATYENVMNAFDEHLIQGGGTNEDTFWFHFSGHGTEQFTAEEFYKPKDGQGNDIASLEPNGKDQNLVCYNPGGTQKGIFIADKEIAAMLNALENGVPAKGDKKPHIVVTLDCCHSGSG
ncbi:MAG: caspase family protein, partial [Bacteroidota bacterium]